MSGIVTVVGIGEDGLAGLADAARAVIRSADLLVGADRHLALVPERDGQARMPWGKDIAGVVERIGVERERKSVVVLASGDPLRHGIAARLIHRFGAEAVSVLPTVGAYSLAAARMLWPLDDPMLACVSVHALPFEGLVPFVQPGARLLILSRTGETPADVARLLVARGFGDSAMTVLERMGGASERRVDGAAGGDWSGSFDNLNVIAVRCVAGPDALRLSRAPGLPDDTFEHDNNITKREVRAVTLAALGPLPGETLWDVGAGNGTVAVEWLRLEPSAKAVAVERDAARAARIETNASGLGAVSLTVVVGDAPGVLADLPAPDAVFIGGGIAEHPDLIDVSRAALRPGGRIVANAVTLEAQAVLQGAAARMGGELVRIGISRAEPVGGFTAFKSAIDVLQWRWGKT